MKKNHWMTRLAGLMLLSYSLLVVGVMAAGTAGSQSDPLVTLSYLNDTFMAQLMGKVDEQLAARDKELSDKLSAQVAQSTRELTEKYSGSTQTGAHDASKDTFVVVSLEKDATLRGVTGCEIMLRSGTATCVSPSSPGLIDETDGTTLESGNALVKDHLYMMTVDERGVRATGETATLLVRGGYTVS